MAERGSSAIGLVVLAAGLAAAGWWISDSLLRFRTADRTVTVKGLAEREVPADLVVWPIAFTEAGNDLTVIYEQTQAHARLIAEYLKGLGLEDAEQPVAAEDPGLRGRGGPGEPAAEPLQGAGHLHRPDRQGRAGEAGDGALRRAGARRCGLRPVG